MRAHRHPPDMLHGWVFRQHQVWVDYWGNEHEIESMRHDYVADVIRFCETRAERIRALVVLDALCGALQRLILTDGRCQLRPEDEIPPAPDEPAVAWLDQMPLVGALRRRLAAGGQS